MKKIVKAGGKVPTYIGAKDFNPKFIEFTYQPFQE